MLPFKKAHLLTCFTYALMQEGKKTAPVFIHYFLPLLAELSELQQLSRDSGLFALEGARPQILEEALHVPAALRPLLLHQGDVQGASLVTSIRFHLAGEHGRRLKWLMIYFFIFFPTFHQLLWKGAPPPAAAVRPGGQQRLQHHHGQKAPQLSHRLPVLH